MLKLNRFYNQISRNAHITLKGKDGKPFYSGPLKSLPDEYDERTVSDFTVSCDGKFIFLIGD